MSDLRDQLAAFFQWNIDLFGKEWYIEERLTPLQEFKRQIENCTRCPLHKTRTNFVFGDGNENAEIMLIGEAPGQEEDLQGLPFVGRSGQLLNKVLAHFNMRREDVYIANILKSRPPNNRDPLPEEVEACIPYLHKQIEIIAPKVLLALGRVAGQNLLQTTAPLKELRGRFHTFRGIPLYITYHPAYILRNMSAIDQMIADFRTVLDKLNALQSSQSGK